ncbi:hypothetical protein [Paraclostridium sordellii]|uniref:hypothetical protein n=1 Tax=Paraclostridium sordellii TaxID=1505 RepID=UPI0005E4C1B3|nr:hypothetical protein [Paeniclostridium sordellii]MDU6249358.1 hypothetical protein [Paeniclostridium sordellii]CEO30647.1 UDP-glucose 4-epimerase [[Clostridium] sordellii] [Paeniclostridium sordellii]
MNVIDLTNGHLKTLEKLDQLPGVVTYNLVVGNRYSVLDMVKAFSQASDIEVAYKTEYQEMWLCTMMILPG